MPKYKGGNWLHTEDSLYHVIKVKLALVLMGHYGIFLPPEREINIIPGLFIQK